MVFCCFSLLAFIQQSEPVERWFISFVCFPSAPQYENVSSSNVITSCQSFLYFAPKAARPSFPYTSVYISVLNGPGGLLFPEENFQISDSLMLSFVPLFSFNDFHTAPCSCQSGHLYTSSCSVPCFHDTIPPSFLGY